MPSPVPGGLEKPEAKNAKHFVGFWKRPNFVKLANLYWYPAFYQKNVKTFHLEKV